jgi:hypothetical protein
MAMLFYLYGKTEFSGIVMKNGGPQSLEYVFAEECLDLKVKRLHDAHADLTVSGRELRKLEQRLARY